MIINFKDKFKELDYTFSADEILTRGGPQTIVSCENARLATKFVVLGTRVLATWDSIFNKVIDLLNSNF